MLVVGVVLLLKGVQGCGPCSGCYDPPMPHAHFCVPGSDCYDDVGLTADASVPGAAAAVRVGAGNSHDPLLVGAVAASALVALLAAGAAVHYQRKAVAVADAKPQQEGEEREEGVARDSTAETATLAGKAMKETSDASYP
jgi:hypothetical protein